MAAFTPGTSIETDTPAIVVDGLAPGIHSFQLVVVDEAGNASLPNLAKVEVTDPSPRLTGFAPAFGQPGDAVALFGTNLENSADKVIFGNVAAPISSVSPTRIDTTVPAGAVTSPIRVDSPKGSAVTAKPFVVPRFTVTRKLPTPVDADHDSVGKALWVSGPAPVGADLSSSVYSLSLPDGVLQAKISVGSTTGDLAVSRSVELRVGMVAHPSNATVTIFSLSPPKLLASISLKSNPDGVAVSQDGTRGLVAMPATGQVAVIDMQAMKILASINVGRLPSKVEFAQNGRLAFVNCAGEGAMVGIDVRNLKTTGRFQVGGATTSNPVQFSVTPTGFPVWSANAGNGTVSLATSATKVGTVDIGLKAACLASDEAAKSAFAAGPSDIVLVRISGSGLKINSVPMPAPGGGFHSLAVTKDGSRVAAAHPKTGTVSFYDGSRMEMLAMIGRLSTPSRIIATDDDSQFCILDPQGAAVTFLDITSLG